MEINCEGVRYKTVPSPPIYEENIRTKLILLENAIEHVDVKLLHKWKSLEYLNLGQNKLKSLTKSADDQLLMKYLRDLDLSYNHLQVLQTYVFSGFSSLVRLNLSHNQIHTISHGAFILPALEELDLSHNQMTEASPHLFETSPRLDIIRFSHNRISRLLGKNLKRKIRKRIFNVLFSRRNILPIRKH